MLVRTGRISDGAVEALDDLRRQPLNFEPALEPIYLGTGEWVVDHHVQTLPAEPPGDPVPGGPYTLAKVLCRDYVFAEPRFVTAAWDDDEPLDGRTIVLQGHFYGLRFTMGLRVGGILDERSEVDGRPAQRWGWNYRTLQGHLERGQMDFEVRKWLDTGEVEFRIDAYSARARTPNPVVRLGLFVFGRWMQGRYARAAKRRMVELVHEGLVAQADRAARRRRT